jgi:hypothetical protein
MASVVYAARETSGTAQANELVLGGSTAPATDITFYSDNPGTPTDENGDLILEHNGGSPDPDTWVEYNGTIHTFTFTVVGTFQVGDAKVPPELWGKQVAKIVLDDGTILFFVTDGTGTVSLLDLIANGRITLINVNTAPPDQPVCFCAGTEILTPTGYRRVEMLCAGDVVLNDSGEARQLMWVGCTRVSLAELRAHPNLRPVRIPEGAIAPGAPKSDLLVSPQHRVVLEGPEAELIFGEERVLVPAKHLVDTLAEVVSPEAEVSYYHLLLEDHEILVSNGLPSESFQPARRTLDAMSEANQKLLVEVLETLGLEEMLTRKDALLSLKRAEGLVLADAIARGTLAAPASAETWTGTPAE